MKFAHLEGAEEMHPRIDFSRVVGNAKPTKASQGIVQGFSMPIYNSDDEELFLLCDVPNWYDGTTDVIIHVHAYLDTANDTKNFNLDIAWEHYTIGTDTIPSTSNTVTVQTATGTASQYQSFEVEFTIDYNIDGGDIITTGDEIAIRFRRIAASANEIVGEVVVTAIGCIFEKNDFR